VVAEGLLVVALAGAGELGDESALVEGEGLVGDDLGGGGGSRGAWGGGGGAVTIAVAQTPLWAKRMTWAPGMTQASKS